MVGKTDKTNNTEIKEAKKSWLDNHDLNEVLKTTNLKILPKFDIIKENDLTTSRKITIESLPESKFIKKVNNFLDYMTINDNGVKYSLPINSLALQRSLISLAIKFSKAKVVNEIDMSTVLGKMVIIKRKQFKSKAGFITAPLTFIQIE